MKLDSKALSPARIHLIGALLTVMLLGISVYAVYSSWESRQLGIESSKQDLTEVAEQLSMTQRERGRLADQIEQLESVVKNLSMTDQPSAINELAARVVSLTEGHALELERFEPGSEILAGENRVQPVDLRVTAPYGSVTRWLDEIHRDMPDIHVVSVSFMSQTADTVSTDIRFNWYIPTEGSPD